MKGSYLTLTVIFSLINCTNSEKTFTVEEIDGVKYVSNLLETSDTDFAFDLELVMSFGESESEDENYNLYWISDVEVDNSGIIYILEGGNHRIQKFSKEGKYVKTLATQGSGPGELINPMSMKLFDDNLLYVSNSYSTSIEVVDTEGNYVERYNMGMMAVELQPMNKNLFAVSRSGNPNGKNFPIYIYGDNSKIVNKLGEIESLGNPDLDMQYNLTRLESDNNGNLFAAYIHQNKIEKYDIDGKLKLSINRKINYEIHGKTVENSFPIITKVSNNISVDDKKRIWVVTISKSVSVEDKDFFAKNDKYKQLEVFDEEGILIGRAKIPEGHTFLNVRYGHAYFSAKQGTILKKYKIIEN